ncbi:conjugal transfer protein TrbL family protein [Paenibacillus prosopidis]|uniref:Uncharacterized protein n=1 Tax=Paenibacillus prosopidis TaxID=630520 RepID=A0A368VJV9_9BACL|nr:conjugal transfer protein TrbL family protein [Paenibacillus prosopidis]RCW41644.1 hypothetical protein DFP97_12280 [Paenibacillus prosopidis]
MVKNFINLVAGFLEYLADESIKLVLTFFVYIGKLGTVVLDMPVVNTGILYTQEVAGMWLAVKIAYEAYMIYILRQMGEPTSDPTNLLIGAVRSASVIAVMPWLMKYMYGFGIEMGFEVAALPGTGYGDLDSSNFTLLYNLMAQAGSALIFIAVAILFAVIMLVVIIIQSFIRASELAVAAWMGSFSALGLTNKDSQGWQSWWKDTLVIIFAAALQMAMLKFSFYTLTPIKVDVAGKWVTVPGIVNLCLFIAALWVTYKAPTILKEKLHSTGIGRVGGAAVQSVGQSAMMRIIMKK